MEQKIVRVQKRHTKIVLEARRKHAEGLPLNGTERYIIQHNVMTPEEYLENRNE